MLRIRQTAQLILLLFFLYLFLNTAYPLRSPLSVEPLLRLSPVSALGTLLADRALEIKILWSLAVIGLTMLLGRFFCGWVCPMGTSIVLLERLIPRRRQRRGLAQCGTSQRAGPRSEPTAYSTGLARRRLSTVKYYVLGFLLVSALFSLSMFLLFDPLVLWARTTTLVLFPPLVFAVNLFVRFFGPVAERIGWIGLGYLSFAQPHFGWGLVTLVLFAGIVAVGLVQSRFWCRNLCPLGALLGLFSRLGPLRVQITRRVSEICTNCALCSRRCPMGAIPEDFRSTWTAECIQCQTCAAVCPEGAISFGPGVRRTQVNRPLHLSRRALMYSGGAGLMLAATAGTGASKVVRDTHLVRPPGSLPEEHFLDRCVRCGACMKVCPTHGLQPTFLESGWEGIWTAHLVPRIGGCEEQCALCGRVCPTGAIRSLPLEEKRFAKIGTAIIERRKCLAWEQLRLCLVCDEACPYDAIEFRVVTDYIGTLQRPFVIEEKCIGCGLCEQKCPVGGEAAIRVDRMGEERLAAGSYITDRKRALREVHDETQDYFKEYRLEPGYEEEPLDTGEEELPPGFIVE